MVARATHLVKHYFKIFLYCLLPVSRAILYALFKKESDQVNKLLEWLNRATPQDKKILAERADSSVASIRLAAKGYRKEGALDLTAEFAGRLEVASSGQLRREDLCKACAECPYQKKCNSKE